MLLQSQREVDAGERGYSVEETLAAMYAILNGAQPPEIFNWMALRIMNFSTLSRSFYFS